MVCKKDVVNWFKNSKSYKRIDVMCTLLNLCVPIELRFLGTCLEHLGKRDFHELRSSENEANNSVELGSSFEGQCIASEQFRTTLAIYISVLHSCNYSSSGAVYKILTKNEDLSPILKNSSDETALDDLLLLYTLAINHPAFTFEQKLTLERISSQLIDEERRISKKGPYSPDSDKTITPLQAYHPTCIVEDGHLISVSTSPQMPVSQVPHHTGEQGISIPDTGGTLRLTYPPPPPQLLLNAAGGWTMVGTPGNGGGGSGPQQPESPIASRTSSPCSRPSSPVQTVPSPAARSKFPPPRVPPPPLTASAINSDAALRETIGKEMPTYVTSLQAYSSEQLVRMTDEELRDIGLNPPAIGQLRSILAPKQHAMTNGVGPPPQHIIEVISPQGPVPKKKDPEPEVMRRYPMEGLAVYPASPFVCHQPPHHTTCYSCYTLPGRKAVPLHYMATGPPPLIPPHYPAPVNNSVVVTEGLRSLRLGTSGLPEDHTSSDTGSDHSPPDTPAPASLGAGGMMVGGGEVVNEERLIEERRASSRRGGMAPRSRNHPPASRGRGAHSVHRRRDMSGNVSNGNSSTSSNNSGSNGGGNNSGGGGVAETSSPGQVPPGSYLGYMTAPYIRHPYPAYHHPAAYVRHGPYPTAYHNGTDIVYPNYPPPGTPGAGPPHPPPPGTFIGGPPPPPVPQYPQPAIMKQASCYNCGSQSHQASDCPDPTIEEVTKQGQYHIDFASSPYPKQPEADK